MRNTKIVPLGHWWLRDLFLQTRGLIRFSHLVLKRSVSEKQQVLIWGADTEMDKKCISAAIPEVVPEFTPVCGLCRKILLVLPTRVFKVSLKKVGGTLVAPGGFTRGFGGTLVAPSGTFFFVGAITSCRFFKDFLTNPKTIKCHQGATNMFKGKP